MLKKWIGVILLLATLLSLAGCGQSSETQPGSVQSASPTRQPTGASPAPMAETYEGGALYDRVPLPLPDGEVFFYFAVPVGDKFLLSGTDADRHPVFYLMDPADFSLSALDIQGLAPDSICSSQDGSLLFLTPDEEGHYTLYTYEGETLVETLPLPPLLEYENNVILALSALENGYIVRTATQLLALDKSGHLLKTLGRYERSAACIPTEDGTVLLVRQLSSPNGEAGTVIDQLDTDFEPIASYTLDGQYDAYYRDSQAGTFLAHSVNTVFRLDYANNQREALIDTYISGMVHELFALPDGRYFSLDRGSPVLWQLSDGSEAVTLTLAAYQLSFMMEMIIHQYNETGGACKIRVLDYAVYDKTEGDGLGLDRLRADIVAGFTPDLYELSNLPAQLYAERGLFEDLTPHLAQESGRLDSLLPNVLRTLDYDGKLYYLTPSFYILSVCGDKSFVGSGGGWTSEDFFAAVEDLDPVTVFGPDMTREQFISTLLLFQGSRYVDRETMSCHFTDSDFERFLAFAALLPEESSDDASQDRGRAYTGHQLLLTEWLGSDALEMSSFADSTFSGEAQYVGFPTDLADHGFALMPEALFSISVSSHHKEAAMDFVRYVLGDTCQSSLGRGLPVVQSALAASLEKKAERYRTFLEQNPDYGLHTFYDDMPIVIMGTPLRPDASERFYRILDQADILAAQDDALFQIIWRECQLYFAGQLPVSQAVLNMQSKAQIYLSEQYG